MKTLKTTKYKNIQYDFLVDDNFEVKGGTFSVIKRSGRYYVRYRYPITRKRIFVHRLVMNAPKGVWIDHINGDTLDNRKKNLRFATPQQSARNRGKPNTNTSGYKGVTKRSKGKWLARITVKRKIIYLGTYTCPKAAHEAYKKAAHKLFGEFANSGWGTK